MMRMMITMETRGGIEIKRGKRNVKDDDKKEKRKIGVNIIVQTTTEKNDRGTMKIMTGGDTERMKTMKGVITEIEKMIIDMIGMMKGDEMVTDDMIDEKRKNLIVNDIKTERIMTEKKRDETKTEQGMMRMTAEKIDVTKTEHGMMRMNVKDKDENGEKKEKEKTKIETVTEKKNEEKGKKRRRKEDEENKKKRNEMRREKKDIIVEGLSSYGRSRDDRKSAKPGTRHKDTGTKSSYKKEEEDDPYADEEFEDYEEDFEDEEEEETKPAFTVKTSKQRSPRNYEESIHKSSRPGTVLDYSVNITKLIKASP
ncbi:glutamic acid-rich protein-like [Ylistrum balloti]|uniref:glutamic acid-rich protein-like n=1 Tax=Ylistrum balloti TaxID=509963 RepID=UPI002905E90D|nr:glutamic acid-rich protein-like [Ylistrum balloti]